MRNGKNYTLKNYIVNKYIPYLREIRTKQKNFKKDMSMIDYILTFLPIINKKIHLIDENDIQILLSKIKNGKNISKQRLNRYRSMLLAIFNHGIRGHYINFNPVANVKRNKEIPRDRVLSNEEIEKLLFACKESKSEELYTVVVLAINTGMRYSEILSIRNEDIENNTILLKAGITKSGHKRKVHMNKATKQALDEYTRKYPNDEKVFKSKSIRKSFATAKKRAMIEEDFRFHDLRRTFATNLMLNNANVRIIQNILGHSSIRMTETYLGSNYKKIVDEMEKICFAIE